jgi:hypothetical protein
VVGFNYTFAVSQTISVVGPSLLTNGGRSPLFEENSMAKISFTLKKITKEIERAEKKLRALRRKVDKADVKKINLNLRALKEARAVLAHVCPPIFHYGQYFQSKPK